MDMRDAIDAYQQASETIDRAASTYLASAPGSSAAKERVPDGHKTVTGPEHHSQARHGRAAPVHPHQSPITAEAASEIASALLNPRVQAFLRLLSFEEFGRERDENYRTRYGDLAGRDPITDQNMLHYEPKNMRPYGKPATAGGAYQILGGTYEEAVRHHVVNDFLPASQDSIAVYLLRSRGALKAIMDHDLDQAFTLLNGTWSSLPGGTQVKENLEDAKSRYNRYLMKENEKK